MITLISHGGINSNEVANPANRKVPTTIERCGLRYWRTRSRVFTSANLFGELVGYGKTISGCSKMARLLTRPSLARRDSPCPIQGRSKRRGEEVHTALRATRSPFA